MVEELFQTYLHIRVVKALAEAETPSTKYTLLKICGVNHRTLERALKLLTKHGWAYKHPYKPVKYSLNRENPSVEKLLEFLKQTGYIN
ncbi:MAG: hypothetical protein QXO30_05085 [Candidatus Caldarchaeum sp.]